MSDLDVSYNNKAFSLTFSNYYKWDCLVEKTDTSYLKKEVHVYRKNSISSYIGYHFNKIFNSSNWKEITLTQTNSKKTVKVLINKESIKFSSIDVFKNVFSKNKK